MAANSKNANGSNWVTARHGGDGKGHMSKAGPAHTINHTGAVNPRKGPAEGSAAEEKTESASEERAEDSEHPIAEQKGSGPENGSQATVGLPHYVRTMADKLRTNHGLTHNHAVRIAAKITAVHAAGHASVDESTRQAAESAHQEMTGLMGGKKSKR
jgi:hypothetical protein